jgi:hypothetical protein
MTELLLDVDDELTRLLPTITAGPGADWDKPEGPPGGDDDGKDDGDDDDGGDDDGKDDGGDGQTESPGADLD